MSASSACRKQEIAARPVSGGYDLAESGDSDTASRQANWLLAPMSADRSYARVRVSGTG